MVFSTCLYEAIRRKLVGKNWASFVFCVYVFRTRRSREFKVLDLKHGGTEGTELGRRFTLHVALDVSLAGLVANCERIVWQALAAEEEVSVGTMFLTETIYVKRRWMVWIFNVEIAECRREE